MKKKNYNNCNNSFVVFVSIHDLGTLESLRVGDIGDKFCGVHHARCVCVGLTAWFTIIRRVQFVSSLF